MIGITCNRAALVLICGLALSLPMSARAEDSIDAKLDRAVDVERPICAELKDLFEYLSDNFGVAVTVDDAAFKREKLDHDALYQKIDLPRMPGIRCRTALEWMLDQADLRYEVRDNKVMIIPMKRGGKEVAFPPAKFKLKERELSLKKVGKKSVDIERPIDDELRYVVAFFEDRLDVAILIDKTAFARHQNNKTVANTKIKLPPKPVVVREALEDLAATVGGVLEFRDDHIRITALPKK
jgi:hypothetical protein